jgi:hypothetical protein
MKRPTKKRTQKLPSLKDAITRLAMDLDMTEANMEPGEIGVAACAAVDLRVLLESIGALRRGDLAILHRVERELAITAAQNSITALGRKGKGALTEFKRLNKRARALLQLPAHQNDAR